MNVFLKELAGAYPNDFILLVADGAAWHKSKGFTTPANIEIFPLPPYTPEMNPIEQIWEEFRKRGFKMKFSKLSTKLWIVYVMSSVPLPQKPSQVSHREAGLMDYFNLELV